ncbi:hypothetical protein C0J52_00328 [Blattella germanica]|nr:hypothetical protein C0J52_00328 [Blattella germanica]
MFLSVQVIFGHIVLVTYCLMIIIWLSAADINLALPTNRHDISIIKIIFPRVIVKIAKLQKSQTENILQEKLVTNAEKNFHQCFAELTKRNHNSEYLCQFKNCMSMFQTLKCSCALSYLTVADKLNQFIHLNYNEIKKNWNGREDVFYTVIRSYSNQILHVGASNYESLEDNRNLRFLKKIANSHKKGDLHPRKSEIKRAYILLIKNVLALLQRHGIGQRSFTVSFLHNILNFIIKISKLLFFKTCENYKICKDSMEHKHFTVVDVPQKHYTFYESHFSILLKQMYNFFIKNLNRQKINYSDLFKTISRVHLTINRQVKSNIKYFLNSFDAFSKIGPNPARSSEQKRYPIHFLNNGTFQFGTGRDIYHQYTEEEKHNSKLTESQSIIPTILASDSHTGSPKETDINQQECFEFLFRLFRLRLVTKGSFSSRLNKHFINFNNKSVRKSAISSKSYNSNNCIRSSTGEFNCDDNVFESRRKRTGSPSNSSPSELDSEFVHLPKAALEFLSFGPTSCPSDLNEPLTYHLDSHLLNSLPLQPPWLPLQPREPLGGCPTTLLPFNNPLRLWPRNLLSARCVCEGSHCSRKSDHRCITVKTTVISLLRNRESSNVRRHVEMIAVGCICAEQKSALVRQLTDSIVV